MIKERKNYGASFKTKVVLEALKERQSVSELSQRFGVSPTLISNWKKAFLESASTLFEPKGKSKDSEKQSDELYKQIGQLKVENDWLKKKLS
jgi:transposase